MGTPPNHLPRFLPTLTEVVRPGGAVPPDGAPDPAPLPLAPQTDASLGLPAVEELVERVMQRLTPVLETRLRAVVDSLVQEQISALEPYLWNEVEQMLRREVAATVTQELTLLGRR